MTGNPNIHHDRCSKGKQIGSLHFTIRKWIDRWLEKWMNGWMGSCIVVVTELELKKICEVTELIYFDGWKEAKNVKLPPWSCDGMHVFWRYKCHSTHKYAHTEAHSHILKCRSVYLHSLGDIKQSRSAKRTVLSSKRWPSNTPHSLHHQ